MDGRHGALGYTVENRKLVVVPEEAATVREIMERYVRSGSVRELLVELRDSGIVSKRRVGRDGQPKGGTPFRRGALYGVLANRTYVGETLHQGKVYAGEHQAIVSRELFDAVQARLAERTNPRSPLCSRKPVSLLTGMIVDQHGRPMSPFHTRNHGRRYTYYASNLAGDASAPAQRLPAREIEMAVRRTLSSWLCDSSNTRQLVADLDTISLARVIETCRSCGHELAASLIDARLRLQELNLRIVVSATGVRASFDANPLLALAVEGADAERIELFIPTTTASFGHEPRLRLDPPAGTPSRRDERLVALLARSFAVRHQLLALSETEQVAMPAVTLRHLERVARLSYLDPSIVRAILDGTQPRSLSARALSRMAALPLSWVEQRRTLGFEPA